VPEPIETWWARRQRSRGADVPYAPGAYRDAWARYPVLVRQYRPEHNRGLLLSQVPPAAEVWLTWLCDVGHVFVATPDEQRHRPGRERRRSSWCPTCADLASPRRLPAVPMDPAPKRPRDASAGTDRDTGTDTDTDTDTDTGTVAVARAAAGPGADIRAGAGTGAASRLGSGQMPVVDGGERAALLRRVGAASGREPGSAPTRRPVRTTASRRPADGTPSRSAPGRTADETSSPSSSRRPTDGTPVRRPAREQAARPPRRRDQLCDRTPDLPVGEAFSSACAPPPASAVEEQLRADLSAAITFTPGVNAVKISRPFFDHVEAWPDVLLPELRVAVEYDSTGRHGLEHVGHREEADRRKDRALRSAGWEVVRIRTGGLEALGPHDLVVSGLTRSTVPQLLDVFREVRGDLYVDAWLS